MGSLLKKALEDLLVVPLVHEAYATKPAVDVSERQPERRGIYACSDICHLGNKFVGLSAHDCGVL